MGKSSPEIKESKLVEKLSVFPLINNDESTKLPLTLVFIVEIFFQIFHLKV